MTDGAIVGTVGNDADLLGTDSDDQIVALKGDDVIDAGAGDDKVVAGKGDDTISDGAGSDTVLAGAGDDHLIYVAGDNQGAQDFFDGGQNTDMLELVMTVDERYDVTFQQEYLAFQEYLAAGKFNETFTFESLGLTVKNIETVFINEINEAPTNVALTGDSVDENLAAGSTVGTVSADDVNTNDELTYGLVDGSGNFSIDADTGVITTNGPLDYESQGSYNVTVSATDKGGLTTSENVTINIGDVNEQPNAGADVVASAAEDVADTVVLASVTASDPDTSADTDTDPTNDDFNDLAYAITGGDPGGLFEIDASGNISLASGQSLDYETATQHNLTVTVTDQNGAGLSDTVQVTLNVTDVLEGIELQPSYNLADIIAGNTPDLSGFVLNGIDVGDYSGRSVSSAGDINNDGVDDLIIGAYGADPNGTLFSGESYVVFGSATVGSLPGL